MKSARRLSAMAVLSALPTLVASACTSAWNQTGPAPFSQAETNRALAPVHELQARCYDHSASAREKLHVRFEFMLYVNGQGLVHAEPRLAEPAVPDMPVLIECVRHQLDALRFPAKGASDQVQLQFEFGAPASAG
jgi:hypothetical protein